MSENPQAFPNQSTDGMTLRDYFAAAAMKSLIVDPDRCDQSRDQCARLSYLMADAMLAQRNEK